MKETHICNFKIDDIYIYMRRVRNIKKEVGNEKVTSVVFYKKIVNEGKMRRTDNK